jgi:hypothetical protein
VAGKLLQIATRRNQQETGCFFTHEFPVFGVFQSLEDISIRCTFNISTKTTMAVPSFIRLSPLTSLGIHP